MISRKELIRYKVNLRAFLIELSCYFGHNVREADLVPLKESQAILEQLKNVSAHAEFASNHFRIGFYEKNSARFRHFLSKIDATNTGEVYVWTAHSDACGLYRVSSVMELNLDFPYECDENGLLALYPRTLDSKLLLDYSEEQRGSRWLDIEVAGRWSSATY